jgi:TaqI-like C-terminal specificity domain
VFPSIIVARKPTDGPGPTTARVCAIPREQLRISDLSAQIATEGFEVERKRLTADAWSLEPKSVVELLAKIRGNGIPLIEYADAKPYRGILTGFNEAFLIDSATRDALVSTDAACADLIKPYLRGQDIKRWHPEWAGLWMIILKSSGDYNWPWSVASDRAVAEDIFRDTYPSLYARMKPMQDALTKRQDKGRHWWELRSCAYWHEFEKPKLVYQEIQFHPAYTLDTVGQYGNNKTFFVPAGNLYLLSILNSPLLWWHNWRFLPHMKDEALSPVAYLMEKMPIAAPTDDVRSRIETCARRLIDVAISHQATRRRPGISASRGRNR